MTPPLSDYVDPLEDDPTPGDLDVLPTETTVHEPSKWAVQQIVAAKLYHDKPMLDSLTQTLLFGATRELEAQGYERLDDEHRAAYSFGKLHHSLTHNAAPEPGAVECDVDCVILPSTEDEATVVLMRIEIGVRRVG